MTTPLDQLPAHAAHAPHRVHVVIETPKGGRNKVAFAPELGIFKLKGVLLILDAPTFSGCVVEARLIGALEVEQQEPDGRTVRNDHLLAVAPDSRQHKSIHALADLDSDMLHEIEHFFISYNEVKGQALRVLRRVGWLLVVGCRFVANRTND